ncbi:hypothetical protein N7490_000435 [Penicillium lividum]|nr:hypothetical protein N7490_000435 [Penicillium lividum]
MPPRKGRKAPRREVAKADESRTLRECWAKLDINDTETKEITIQFLQKLYDSTKPWNFQRLDDRRAIKEVMSENLDDMVPEVQDAAQTKESRAVHQLYRIIQLKRGDWEGKISKKRTRPVVTTRRQRRRQRSRSQIDLSQSPLPTPRPPWLTPPRLPREQPGVDDLQPPPVQDESDDSEPMEVEEEPQSRGSTPGESDTGSEEQEQVQESESESSPGSGSVNRSYRATSFAEFAPRDYSVTTISSRSSGRYSSKSRPPSEDESQDEPGDESGDECEDSDSMVVDEELQSRGSTPDESDAKSEEQEQDSGSESGSGSGSDNQSQRLISVELDVSDAESVMSQEHPASESDTQSRRSRGYKEAPRKNSQSPDASEEEQEESGELDSADESEVESVESIEVDEDEQSRDDSPDRSDEESVNGSDNGSEHSMNLDDMPRHRGPTSEISDESSDNGSDNESTDGSEEGSDNESGSNNGSNNSSRAVSEIGSDDGSGSDNGSNHYSADGSDNESSSISASDNGSDNNEGSKDGSKSEASDNESDDSSRADSEDGSDDESRAESEDGSESGTDENRSSEELEGEAGQHTEHEPEQESSDVSETGRSSEEPAEQSDAGSRTGTYNEMSDAETQDNPDEQDSESNDEDQSGDESERESGDEANDQSEIETTRESVDKTEDSSGDEQGEASDNEEVSGDEQEEASGDDQEEASGNEEETPVNEEASNDEQEEYSGGEEEASDDDQEEVSENEAEDTHEDQAETDAEDRPDQEMMDVSEDESENASEDYDEDMRDRSAEPAQIDAVDSEEDEEMKDVSEDEDEDASGDEAKTQAEDSSDEELENAPTNDSEDKAENDPQEQSDDKPEETSEHDQEESSCGEQEEASSDEEDTSADKQEEGSEDNQEEASSDEEDTSADEQEGGSDEDQEASGDETEKDLEHSSEDDAGDESPDHEFISITSGDGQEDSRKSEAFDSSRISVVPNANVDIIRVDDPHRPISIRLNDLLKDRNDPRYQSADGHWVDISQLHIKVFQKHLMNEGLFRLGADQIWWNSSALKDIDISKIDIPQGDENRLTELTMITTIKRSIDPYYPGLGITLGNQELFEIPRPTFTVIIRDASTTGGILDRSRERSLSRPDLSRSYRYTPSLIHRSSSNGTKNFAALFEASKQIAHKSEHGSVDSDVEVVSRISSPKRKSPDSEACSSDRPVQRRRASSDTLSLQNLGALQFHDAIKAQGASKSGSERYSTASSTQVVSKPREAPDILAGLEFHDAMKFLAEHNDIEESESVRGPNSAGSNALSQDEHFGKYRESAKLSPSTIEGISPPVPLAQEPPTPFPLGADLWEHHVPIKPPKPRLSAEQKFDKLLTTVLDPLTHSLRQLNIQYKTPPRPPVLTKPESPFDWENWLKLDPWGFIQHRIPPKTKKEADLQAKTANIEPSSIRLGEMSLGHPIPRTRTPAFTPSPEISPTNPSPPSPRGSPPYINKIMMVGYLIPNDLILENHIIREYILVRKNHIEWEQDAIQRVEGLAYSAIRFHTTSIPMANFPILFNLIPKFNIPMVSSMAKMRTVNDHARVLQERSVNSPHDDSTRDEAKRLTRRTSVHSDQGGSKKRREEPQALVRRKVKLLEEIEDLEKEIRWLPKFRTDQEGRVKELQERIEELEGKEFRKKKNIGRLDDARDELARELENGWDKLDRMKRITRRLKGDDPSWSRTRSPPPYRKSWDWNERRRSTTRRRQRREDMALSPKSRRHPSRASDKSKATTTKQVEKQETKVKKEDQEGNYEMGELIGFKLAGLKLTVLELDF